MEGWLPRMGFDIGSWRVSQWGKVSRSLGLEWEEGLSVDHLGGGVEKTGLEIGVRCSEGLVLRTVPKCRWKKRQGEE